MATREPEAAARSRLNAGNRWNLLALVCAIQFIDTLGVTVVVVALPEMDRDLALGAALSWVGSVYAVTFGGFLVLGGRATDLYGTRRLFLVGTALLTVGSLVCGLAPAGAALVLGRALQGLGAAAAVPAALAALLRAFPSGRDRARALSVWTAAGAGGGAAGFVVGGLVTEAAGWRWIFLGLAPLGLVAMLLATQLMNSDAPTRRGRLDVVGATLATSAVVLTVLGFSRAEAESFASPLASVPLLLAPVVVVAFVTFERRVQDPVVAPSIWSVRPLVVASLVATVLTAVTSGAAVISTVMLQRVLNLSAGSTGVVFLAFSASVIAGSAAAVRVAADPVGRMAAMVSGLTGIGVSMLLATVSVAQRSVWPLVASLALSGLALGVASVASTAHGTSSVDDEDSGTASGLLNTAAQIGTAIGIAVLLAAAGHADSAQAEQADAGLIRAYSVAAALAFSTALWTATTRHVRAGVFLLRRHRGRLGGD